MCESVRRICSSFLFGCSLRGGGVIVQRIFCASFVWIEKEKQSRHLEMTIKAKAKK